MSAISLFEQFSKAIQKPETRTDHNILKTSVVPGQLGIALNGELSQEPKRLLQHMANEMPMQGIEPEKRAGLNMVAKRLDMAAKDAEFYVGVANRIGKAAASLHGSQVRHFGNMAKHDLSMKKSDTQHLSNVGSYQESVMTILDVARQKHAEISLYQMSV